MQMPLKGELSKLNTIVDTNDTYRFLSSLIIAMDANFRLKSRACTSDNLDPGLHTGLAYFVSNGPYNEHVLQFAMQDDVCMSAIHG